MTKLLSQITSFVVVFSIAAGDDKDALAVTWTLVRDAGFDPVMIGPLERAKDFAQGARLYVRTRNHGPERQERQVAPVRPHLR
jgi:predicted dinucleotide-binding enzyme